ncbi:hypothetical protein [Dyella silvatica]|uniref:hypothetical protein n=1 Tax=Dyella silvatica TaxID=2992128 RepID=UPI00224F7F40|nr:hypothetical protein [Dyella silvatica]
MSSELETGKSLPCEEIHGDQLDADVLAWRRTPTPTDSFIDRLVEMHEIVESAAAAMPHASAAQSN